MRIETERLLLRELVAEDVADLFKIESAPEMVRYQDFEPRTRESAADYVSRAIEVSSQEPRPWIELAVCRDGEMIGRVGGSFEARSAWLWYAIAPSRQGNGYAKEAVAALIKATKPLVDVFMIECDPRNIASCRVAESLEFRRTTSTDSTVVVKGETCGSRVYALEFDLGSPRRER